MFASHTLITGGTITLVHNDVYHRRLRGVFLSFEFYFVETHRLVKSVESSDNLHRETATAGFRNWKERFDPPTSHPNTRFPLHASDTVIRQEMPLKPEIFHGRDDFVEDIAQFLLHHIE